MPTHFLGFTAARTYTPSGSAEPSWAWLESGDAALMIESASHPIVASEQAIILVLYAEDVATKHTELTSVGLSVGRLSTLSILPAESFFSPIPMVTA